MKKIALPVLTVCFALAALVFAYLWYVEKSNDSDLKQLAQASATDAYTQFSSYQTNGNDSDYWSGVASFRSLEQAYVLLVQDTNKETNYLICNDVYGSMISNPDKCKDNIDEIVSALEYLSEDVESITAHDRMLELRNTLRH